MGGVNPYGQPDRKISVFTALLYSNECFCFNLIKITTIADAENQCYRCHQLNRGRPQERI